MGFGSLALIPLWVLASLLLDPGGLCYSDYNQMRGFDDYRQEGDYDAEGFGGDPTSAGQKTCLSNEGLPQPCQSTVPPDDRPPWQGEGQFPRAPAMPSPPPPPPPTLKPPAPRRNASRNEWNVSPLDGGEKQGEEEINSYVATLGWAFLAAALVLQLVLGAYLAYQRRELDRFGMWLEKIPSISPPPSPAGFAPYTAGR